MQWPARQTGRRRAHAIALGLQMLLGVILGGVVILQLYWWGTGATVLPPGLVLEDDWYPETLREWQGRVDLLAESGSCAGLISLYNDHFGGDRADQDLFNHWWEQVMRTCDELRCDPELLLCESVMDRLRRPPGCPPPEDVPHCKNWPWG